jgi:23S rRNA (guanosine2251-2'-O)-methyltransferase
LLTSSNKADFIILQKTGPLKKLSLSELGRHSADAYGKLQKIPLVVVLDNLRSQHNIGSVFRTADAFLVEEVFLCGITATPPNKEMHKTALGSTETVKWQYFPETRAAVELLITKGYDIIIVEQTDTSIAPADFIYEPGRKLAVVFGNEVRGVDESILELAGMSIEIPQYGTKHSLNVSVCAGIILWELSRKMMVIN